MGLVSHALAFGLGYVLGRPGGRQQVVQLGHQVTELADKPEVKRLAARGRELANDKALAAKDAVTARVSGKNVDSGSVATPPATPSPATSPPATSPATPSPASPSPATSPRADAPPTVPAPSARPPAPSED
jgi:cell division protein FtsN